MGIKSSKSSLTKDQIETIINGSDTPEKAIARLNEQYPKLKALWEKVRILYNRYGGLKGGVGYSSNAAVELGLSGGDWQLSLIFIVGAVISTYIIKNGPPDQQAYFKCDRNSTLTPDEQKNACDNQQEKYTKQKNTLMKVGKNLQDDLVDQVVSSCSSFSFTCSATDFHRKKLAQIVPLTRVTLNKLNEFPTLQTLVATAVGIDSIRSNPKLLVQLSTGDINFKSTIQEDVTQLCISANCHDNVIPDTTEAISSLINNDAIKLRTTEGKPLSSWWSTTTDEDFLSYYNGMVVMVMHDYKNSKVVTEKNSIEYLSALFLATSAKAILEKIGVSSEVGMIQALTTSESMVKRESRTVLKNHLSNLYTNKIALTTGEMNINNLYAHIDQKFDIIFKIFRTLTEKFVPQVAKAYADIEKSHNDKKGRSIVLILKELNQTLVEQLGEDLARGVKGAGILALLVGIFKVYPYLFSVLNLLVRRITKQNNTDHCKKGQVVNYAKGYIWVRPSRNNPKTVTYAQKIGTNVCYLYTDGKYRGDITSFGNEWKEIKSDNNSNWYIDDNDNKIGLRYREWIQ
tara:strand:+ start:813 stop:2525 length:1713 start_codon:yes stop_codon:yes gene_type:complete